MHVYVHHIAGVHITRIMSCHVMSCRAQANESEDTALLEQLHEEARVLVGEVESVVAAEPELSDEARAVLRVSAYDVYDMLVMSDELLHADRADPTLLQAALEIIRVFAPGSESHVQVRRCSTQQHCSALPPLSMLLQRPPAMPCHMPCGCALACQSGGAHGCMQPIMFTSRSRLCTTSASGLHRCFAPRPSAPLWASQAKAPEASM